MPSYVKEKRFHNWLENARDWVSTGASGGVGGQRQACCYLRALPATAHSLTGPFCNLLTSPWCRYLAAVAQAVSRSRFWGTPMPIWISDDMEEVVVVGSVAELEELTGHKVGRLLRP